MYNIAKNKTSSARSDFDEMLSYTYLSMFTTGCIGNTLIIIYFANVNRRKLKKMSAYHFLLILLAIVDLNVCAASLFFESLYLFNSFLYNNNKTILNYFQRPLSATSIYILVIISFLRYKAITNPLEHQWNKKCYFLLCLFSFSCSNGLWILVVIKVQIPIAAIDLAIFGIAPLIMLCFFLIKMSKSLNNINENITIIPKNNSIHNNNNSCSHDNKNTNKYNNNNNKNNNNNNTSTTNDEQKTIPEEEKTNKKKQQDDDEFLPQDISSLKFNIFNVEGILKFIFSSFLYKCPKICKKKS